MQVTQSMIAKGVSDMGPNNIGPINAPLRNT